MKKYVLVGASGRASMMYAKPIEERFKDTAKIVGVFDINPLRIEALKKLAGIEYAPSYTDFDKMIEEQKPDIGIVTTMDSTHHEYICRLMEKGVDVITEKPMTNTIDRCKAILECQKKTKRDITVTFNYRFIPYVTKAKEVIRSGVLGNIYNVDYEYILSDWHGGDYFRRWHSYEKNIGSLLVHKSTHHFDLINWWIEKTPKEVFAFGERKFWGDDRYKDHGERCLTCENPCKYKYNWDAVPIDRPMYLECESADGYFRDRCLYRNDIDLPDTFSVTCKYEDDILMTYSLVTYGQYEGFRCNITGDKGRLELHYGDSFKSLMPEMKVYSLDGSITLVHPGEGIGDHGGGDARIQDMLFRGVKEDPLGHAATCIDGVKSIMIGICSNISIKEGRKVVLKDELDWTKY